MSCAPHLHDLARGTPGIPSARAQHLQPHRGRRDPGPPPARGRSLPRVPRRAPDPPGPLARGPQGGDRPLLRPPRRHARGPHGVREAGRERDPRGDRRGPRRVRGGGCGGAARAPAPRRRSTASGTSTSGARRRPSRTTWRRWRRGSGRCWGPRRSVRATAGRRARPRPDSSIPQRSASSGPEPRRSDPARRRARRITSWPVRSRPRRSREPLERRLELAVRERLHRPVVEHDVVVVVAGRVDRLVAGDALAGVEAADEPELVQRLQRAVDGRGARGVVLVAAQRVDDLLRRHEAALAREVLHDRAAAGGRAQARRLAGRRRCAPASRGRSRSRPRREGYAAATAAGSVAHAAPSHISP